MTVNITARGPAGHRDYKPFYREGLDADAMRTLVEALQPMLPDDCVYPADDEDTWQFYGVLAHGIHPARFNAAMAHLRASGSAEAKAAIATLGDAMLTELGAQSQLIQLSVNPWRDSSGKTKMQVIMSTDGNALDEPTRNACLSNARALYRAYGLTEPDGREFHVVPAAAVLEAAAGSPSNELVAIAEWAIGAFGPDATVCCH